MGKSIKTKKKRRSEKAKRDFFLILERKKEYFVVGILFIHLLLALLLFDPKLFTGGDNAKYIILAKSLLSGEGFRNLEAPGSPPHTQYPFGFPLLLTPILFFSQDNFLFLKFFMLSLSLGTLFFLYLFLVKIFPWLVAMALLLLMAVHPVIVEYSHWVLTEIPFLFFSLLSLFLFRGLTRHRICLFLAPLSIVMTYYIRSAGMALLLAAPLFFAYKKEFQRLILFLFLFFLLLSPWVLRGQVVGEEGSPYLTQFLLKNPYDIHSGQISFSELLSRVRENAVLYSTRIIPTALLSYKIFFQSQKTVIFALLLVGVMIYGFITDLKRGVQLEHFYLILYSAIILLWPSVWSSIRFIIPILPFLFLYFALGMIRILQSFKRANPRGIFSLLVVLLFFFHLKTNLQMVPENLRMLRTYLQGDPLSGYSPDWRNYFETATWAKENLSEDSVVLSRKPALFFLYSHRKSIVYPFTRDRDELYHSMITNEIDYVVVDAFRWTGTTPRYLIPVLQEHSKEFEIVYATEQPKTFLLKFLKGG